MRKKIVAGNWKMNLLSEEAFSLANGINEARASVKDVHLIVFPPAVFASSIIEKNDGLSVGLQNFYPAEKGAFTGEISVSHVKNIGATHVLVGHSERRAIFNEHELFLKEKVDAALLHGLTPVFC